MNLWPGEHFFSHFLARSVLIYLMWNTCKNNILSRISQLLQKSLTHDYLSIIVEIKMLQRETLVWPSSLPIYLYLTEQDLLYQQKD